MNLLVLAGYPARTDVFSKSARLGRVPRQNRRFQQKLEDLYSICLSPLQQICRVFFLCIGHIMSQLQSGQLTTSSSQPHYLLATMSESPKLEIFFCSGEPTTQRFTGVDQLLLSRYKNALGGMTL